MLPIQTKFWSTSIPSDSELVTDNSTILKIFGYRCVMCRKTAGFVHEIEPRSLRPLDWARFDNRVALCGGCHEFVHQTATRLNAERLKKLRREYLELHYAYHHSD